MREEDIYSSLFGFGSNTTFYTWKKDPKRIIFKLLNQYFSKDELEEFLQTGKIKKFDDLSFINKFYDDNGSEFIYLFYKTHHLEKEKFYIFSLAADIISSSPEDINKIKNIEMFYTKLFKDNKFYDDELFVDVIKNSPISNQLFFYIKLNIQENWAPLKQYLSKEDNQVFSWLLDYLELIKISKTKNLFEEIFNDGPGVIGHRKLPNIPVYEMESAIFNVHTTREYSIIIKNLIKKIENGTWDDDLFVNWGSEPFSTAEPAFVKWTTPIYLDK